MLETIRAALSDWRVLSPVIIVLASQVFLVLERRFPYIEQQRVFRKGWFNMDFALRSPGGRSLAWSNHSFLLGTQLAPSKAQA
jgi:hypothetical protein